MIQRETKVNKPLYTIPSMQEIGHLPWNGYNVVSSFSGCGGSCLGYRMAGYRVIWANEFIPAAQSSYKANHPSSILDTRDIRKVQPEEILKAIGLQQGGIDIFDGSPPCASFSTAGKREASWGKVKNYSDTKQRVDDLFFEYVRLLKGLQPKVFVAENVSGLVKGTAKGYFLEILKELKACGYQVEAKVLDAQWLGVPQMRQRLIFVGVRNDLVRTYHVKPAHPSPLPYFYTVRDALPWIVKQAVANDVYEDASQNSRTTVLASTGARTSSTLPGEHLHYVEAIVRQGDNGGFGKGGWQDADSSAHGTIGASPQTGNGNYPPSLVEVIRIPIVEPESSMSGYAIGDEWEKLREGGQSEKYFQLVKPSLGNPCPTITQRGGDNTVASVTHPTEKRKFSIAELKRICAFPHDFILTGTYAQQWERLGRAVPPLMMYRIAKTLQEEVLDRCQQV